MTRTEVMGKMRDFDDLPLLTPWEAFERAREMGWNHPLFDHGYRVQGLNAWKAIETLLRQYDVEDVVIASFGLNRFGEIFDAFAMMSERGWHLWQAAANVYVGGELRTVPAIRARYRGD